MSDLRLRELERRVAQGEESLRPALERELERAEGVDPRDLWLVARVRVKGPGKVHLLRPMASDWGPWGRATGYDGDDPPIAVCGLARLATRPGWERDGAVSCSFCRSRWCDLVERLGSVTLWELQLAYGLSVGVPHPAIEHERHLDLLRRVERALARAGRFVHLTALLPLKGAS